MAALVADDPTGMSWQWARSRDGESGWEDIESATSTSYVPTGDDAGHYLRATVSYTDGDGNTQSAEAITTDQVALGAQQGGSGVRCPWCEPEPIWTPTPIPTATFRPQCDGSTARHPSEECATRIPDPDPQPTQEPTEEPTQEPTQVPTQEPTEDPTQEPTQVPTQEPTEEPTQEPTEDPTPDPSATAEASPVPTIRPPSPLDNEGYQADKIVQYQIIGLVDPLIADAVTLAADLWNTAVRERFTEGGGALTCQRRGNRPPPNVDQNLAFCPAFIENDDGKTLSIKMVDGSVPSIPSGCNTKLIACVIPSGTKDQPIPSQTMYINQSPGILWDSDDDGIGEDYVVEWTNDLDEHGEDTLGRDGIPGVKIYLPGVVAHELGHSFGFKDLEGSANMGRMMFGEQSRIQIPIADIPAAALNDLGAHYAD